MANADSAGESNSTPGDTDNLPGWLPGIFHRRGTLREDWADVRRLGGFLAALVSANSLLGVTDAIIQGVEGTPLTWQGFLTLLNLYVATLPFASAVTLIVLAALRRQFKTGMNATAASACILIGFAVLGYFFHVGGITDSDIANIASTAGGIVHHFPNPVASMPLLLLWILSFYLVKYGPVAFLLAALDGGFAAISVEKLWPHVKDFLSGRRNRSAAPPVGGPDAAQTINRRRIAIGIASLLLLACMGSALVVSAQNGPTSAHGLVPTATSMSGLSGTPTATLAPTVTGTSTVPSTGTPVPSAPAPPPMPTPTPTATLTPPRFTEYPASAPPWDLATGPDGNLYFNVNAGQIGRMTPDGAVHLFQIPTAPSGPRTVTAGPDGNVWFTEFFGNRIGRITPGGTITEFPIPTSNAGPSGITNGADGNLWFTETNSSKIGRITPSGTFTEYPAASSQPPGVITSGPDGNLWFVEASGPMIGRFTLAGKLTEFPASAPGAQLWGITSGPDGNVWFVDQGANRIGRITPPGSVTEFPIPTANSKPVHITSGPDGNLWFSESAANQIGRITPAGEITETPIPTANSNPLGMAAGPKASVWFSEASANQVGQLMP